ncbi:MAG: MoaD/ThiS family protein [Spirochaetaceae bacterium]|nr:MoaD/ThiS family protein [Spirochaetaceae bacterium]
MKVRVYPPSFADSGALDDEGFLELNEGCVLDDVYTALRITFPLKHIVLCFVNYERAILSARLEDGDIVSFFSIVSGG